MSKLMERKAYGKDQRNWFMRHKIISFIGIIVIFIMIGSALSDDDEVVKEPESDTTNEVEAESTEEKRKNQ